MKRFFLAGLLLSSSLIANDGYCTNLIKTKFQTKEDSIFQTIMFEICNKGTIAGDVSIDYYWSSKGALNRRSEIPDQDYVTAFKDKTFSHNVGYLYKLKEKEICRINGKKDLFCNQMNELKFQCKNKLKGSDICKRTDISSTYEKALENFNELAKKGKL